MLRPYMRPLSTVRHSRENGNPDFRRYLDSRFRGSDDLREWALKRKVTVHHRGRGFLN